MSSVARTNSGRKELALENLVERFGQLVTLELSESSKFADIEGFAFSLGNEVVRQFLERRLQAMADAYSQRVRVNFHHDEAGRRPINDVVYKQHQRGSVSYWCLAGKLEVSRSTYRDVGVRNGQTIVPLEREAGLVEGMTPGLAKSVMLGQAKGPLRSYREDLAAAYRVAPPRATLVRKAKAAAERAAVVNFHVEPVLRAEEKLPKGTAMVVLGTDRTSVPMAEPGAACRRRRRKKPYERKKPPSVTVNWRMDYVATIAFYDRAGEKLASRRYHAPNESPGHQVVHGIIADLERALEQKRKLRVVVVQDGAMELWNTLRYWLEASDRVTSWTEVLDWYHASERMHRCLALIEPDAHSRKPLAKAWTRKLLATSSGPRQLVSLLRDNAKRASGELQQELEVHANYFERRIKQMAYHRFRKGGVPIGSGVTEGACKSLVGARAKRSGQRWSRVGLSNVLRLRAIHQSDRFDRFWDRYADRYRASRVDAA